MAGLTADTERSRTEKDELDETYKRVSGLTYGNAPESTEEKTAPRKRKATTHAPQTTQKKQKGQKDPRKRTKQIRRQEREAMARRWQGC